tara:strand:- start:134 stop:1264 length:1131 start_codon:yes stop_codon:yes gene_type:complete
MYKTKISTEINSNDWNSELKKSNYSTYLQTAEYLNINSNENTFPIFISVLDEKNAVVGQLGLLIIKTSVQYGSALFQKLSKTISGVSTRGIWQYGPTIHTENKMEKKEILRMILKANNEIIKKYNLVFIEGYSAPLDVSLCDEEIKEYEKYGYNTKKFVAFLTDLKKPIEEIWKNVQQYAKKNVNRAAKRGVTIKELKTFEDSKQAISLFQKWGKTKGLIISDPEQQLKKFWDRQNSGFEKTFLAFKEEQLVSSITISHFNNIVVPIQVLNSYSSIARNLGGPALTWYAIKWSKEFKFGIYDITGGPLLPENEQVNDKKRPFSLIHYKKKWGGKQYIHYHFIKINKKSSYMIYKKLFKILKWYHNKNRSFDDVNVD